MGTCLNALDQFDRNFDGQISIADILGTLKAFANLPAEIVIDSMAGSDIYRFFELSLESCTSNSSFVLSIVVWLMLGYLAVQTMGYSDDRARKEYDEKKREMGY